MTIYYPNHKKETYKCQKCGWTGLGEEAIMGDEYAGAGFELDCPVCPEIEEVGFVEFPFLEDVAKNGTGIDKIMANQRLDFLDNLKKSQLKRPKQLPDLNCWQLTFVMQVKEIDNQRYIVVNWEGKEIWKELYHWEFYQRFLDIGDILSRKYGKYMMDFIPDVNWTDIYGDSLSAADTVHDYRMEIREKYNKRIKDIKDKERRKNPKTALDRLENSIEQLEISIIEKEKIYNDLKKKNALDKKLAAEERRKNPKNFLHRWLNKFEQWMQPIND